MCMVMPKTTYHASFNGLGIPRDKQVEVVVIREAAGWNVSEGERLARRGNRFEGDIHLDPGNAFLVFVKGINREASRRVFEARKAAGLVAEGEEFTYNHSEQGFYACITDDPRFPCAKKSFPYPVNEAPLPAKAAIAS